MMRLNNNEVLLISKQGINYRRLTQLLATEQWKAADAETSKLMLQIMGKSNWYEVYPSDLDNFSYTDLITIDQLWIKYSGGKFGFSVQKEIWLKLGGSLYADYNTEKKFVTQVGWRNGKDWLNYEQLTFNLDAPQGHFPIGCDNMRQVWCWALLSRLFSRLVYHNLHNYDHN